MQLLKILAPKSEKRVSISGKKVPTPGNKALISKDRVITSKNRTPIPENKLALKNGRFKGGESDCFFLSNVFKKASFLIFYF